MTDNFEETLKFEEMIKKEIGYKQESPTCESCLYCSEKQDSHLDRTYMICNVAYIRTIPVKKDACCTKYFRKK